MDQPQHFDISSLLSCLHQLRTDNQKLEDRFRQLLTRRDHLIAVNARLSIPLNGIGALHPTPQTGYSPALNATNLSQVVAGHPSSSSSSTSPASSNSVINGNSNFYALSTAQQHLQTNGMPTNALSNVKSASSANGSLHDLSNASATGASISNHGPNLSSDKATVVNGTGSTNGNAYHFANSLQSSLSQFAVNAQAAISFPSTSGMMSNVVHPSPNNMSASAASLASPSLFQSLISQQQSVNVNPNTQRSNSKR